MGDKYIHFLLSNPPKMPLLVLNKKKVVCESVLTPCGPVILPQQNPVSAPVFLYLCPMYVCLKDIYICSEREKEREKEERERLKNQIYG